MRREAGFEIRHMWFHLGKYCKALHLRKSSMSQRHIQNSEMLRNKYKHLKNPINLNNDTISSHL